ncbi:hypothetical protein BB381_00280 [Campylobacter pinnipediorum subsp. caledonicus]|uniref:hypothetical protein n=1 Tax=Campylobacter pinnipediorum TaxID=1965231 RepID=UPI000995A4C8|nr:hypothetical protein [Campylobacter pinnipediorum]AQW85535.1 hypothetical protein CPIN18020_0291 [Campylobacter pinnipediorum subsp. caledonicus]OPA72024.1 hypothetical protein BB381_00280 [Campylobacter pinnipediorum subsp. caledonicus]
MIFDSLNFNIVHQGIDTLVLGIRCNDEEYYKNEYSEFISKIYDLKNQAQLINTYGEKYILDDLGSSYGNFKVSSKGLGNYFGFFENDDIFCLVGDTSFKNKQMYHLKIQFRSIFLLKYGHKECYNRVKAFLNDIFKDKFDVEISRVDICTDVAGIKYTPQDFLKFRSLKRTTNYTHSTYKHDSTLIKDDETETNLINLEQMTINNFMQYNRFEGIAFGKSPCMFRIYDKVNQVIKKRISNLIFTKWELCGYDINSKSNVYRHEIELGRPFVKKLMGDNVTDEISFLFDNLGKFWAYGLKICKWYDLTDDEVKRLTESNIKSDSKRLIYFRCEADTNRLNFWDMINKFDEENNEALYLHKFINTRDIKKVKIAFKSFISSVYSNLGSFDDNFTYVINEVKKDLAMQKISLHEYGLSKMCGSFNKNEQIIKGEKLDVINPLYPSLYRSLDDLLQALQDIRNDDYKKDIEKSLTVLKNDGYIYEY